jgi:hypothetical protein
LNKELDRKNIKYQILNIQGKIPNHPSIILTTSIEAKNIEMTNNQAKLLPYSEEEDFEQYILKIIAAFRIKYKKVYSKVLFSIDPGTKYLGIVVFLDDYYLDSSTLFTTEDLLKYIEGVIEAFQNELSNSLKISFKIGMGIIDNTYTLISRIYTRLTGKFNIQVYLIDEVSSSKIRISNIKFPKHETSAIMLSFRKGLEIHEENYRIVFRRLRLKKIRYEKFKAINYGLLSNKDLNLSEIAEDIIRGKLSLSEVTGIIDRTFLEKQKFNFS